MHGVPADLDLSAFVGAPVARIDLGPYIIHFRFAADVDAVIGVEGDWELRDASGALLDQQQEPQGRHSYRLHVLLDRTVTATEVSAPESFTLRFDSGHTLRIFDRSSAYESFSIQPGDVYV